MEELLKALTANPETAKILIQSFVATYKPILYSALQELFTLCTDLVDNDEYFRVNAEYSWKRYKALTDCGFTPDQAMALMLREDTRWQNQLAKNSQTIAKSTEKISKIK